MKSLDETLDWLYRRLEPDALIPTGDGTPGARYEIVTRSDKVMRVAYLALIAGLVLYGISSHVFDFARNWGELRASWSALGSCSTLSCALEQLGACLELSEIAIFFLGGAMLILLPKARRSHACMVATLGIPTFGQFSLPDKWPFASACLCMVAEWLLLFPYPSPQHAGRVFLCLFSMCLMLVRIRLSGNRSEQSTQDAGGQAREGA